MADHMTAEQLRAELERIANHCEDAGLIVAPGELRNIAARLSGMAAVPTWQPIETAPKRRRVFLASLIGGKWRCVVASYYTQDDMADWENGDECSPGWYERSDAHEDATETVYLVGGEPKFWRPLPAAPEPPHD